MALPLASENCLVREECVDGYPSFWPQRFSREFEEDMVRDVMLFRQVTFKNKTLLSSSSMQSWQVILRLINLGPSTRVNHALQAVLPEDQCDRPYILLRASFPLKGDSSGQITSWSITEQCSGLLAHCNCYIVDKGEQNPLLYYSALYIHPMQVPLKFFQILVAINGSALFKNNSCLDAK